MTSSTRKATGIVQRVRERWNANRRIYPCATCGKMRSKNEGGTVFTVCDECWDKQFKLPHQEQQQ